MPVELADVPMELADMPMEVMWFSVIEFSFAGCFRGRPRPRFTAGSAGSVSLRGTFGVGKSAFSLSSSAGASSLSGLTVASGLFSLTSWLSLG